MSRLLMKRLCRAVSNSLALARGKPSSHDLLAGGLVQLFNRLVGDGGRFRRRRWQRALRQWRGRSRGRRAPTALLASAMARSIWRSVAFTARRASDKARGDLPVGRVAGRVDIAARSCFGRHRILKRAGCSAWNFKVRRVCRVVLRRSLLQGFGRGCVNICSMSGSGASARWLRCPERRMPVARRAAATLTPAAR